MYSNAEWLKVSRWQKNVVCGSGDAVNLGAIKGACLFHPPRTSIQGKPSVVPAAFKDNTRQNIGCLKGSLYRCRTERWEEAKVAVVRVVSGRQTAVS